ncbi:MAG: lipoprotein [Burkholderiaceae bacterium]|nr:lipoprotein [Burkholderiaceae bacterium]
MRPAPPAPAPSARRSALLAVAASLLVVGCGQRGPLYLPENAPPRRRRRGNPQPSSAASSSSPSPTSSAAPAASPSPSDPQQ